MGRSGGDDETTRKKEEEKEEEEVVEKNEGGGAKGAQKRIRRDHARARLRHLNVFFAILLRCKLRVSTLFSHMQCSVSAFHIYDLSTAPSF